MKLPLYKIDITENDDDKIEVDYISLVNNPAIQTNFLAFSADRENFAIVSEDEKIITGPALIADLPILRKDTGDKGEHYVFFNAPTIKKIAQRFFRKKYNFNLNLSHNRQAQPDGVYVYESWIVDREKGKAPPEAFSSIANGSWLITAKIDNAELWDKIKQGEFKGFSVEGLFTYEKIEVPQEFSQETINKIKKILQEIEL